MLNTLVICLTLLFGAPSAEWTRDVEVGLKRAQAEQRVVLLSLGSATEARSERHVLEVYRSKSAKPYLEASVNLAAWTWPGDEVGLLSDFGEYTPVHHTTNLERFKERWLRPNELGVVAQPQHVWLSPAGEVLLSVPFEISALEFAWCFDEALRRAGIESRPDLPKGAHPPRRLLLGEVFRLANDDEYGRGLWPRELEVVLASFQKRNLTMADAADLRRVLFTDEADAAESISDEFGKWDLASSMMRDLTGILDGTVYLLGQSSTTRFLPALEQFARHPRASMRSQVAVAFEQIGDPTGLALVKSALKKEDDDAVRALWVRALGACGRSNASASKELIRIAQKDKVDAVRYSAVLALGYVLPEPKAEQRLLEFVASGPEPERRAALLALALGRCVASREIVAAWTAEEVEEPTRSAAAAALAVLDGGNLSGLRESVAELLPDAIDRRRVFFAGGF